MTQGLWSRFWSLGSPLVRVPVLSRRRCLCQHQGRKKPPIRPDWLEQVNGASDHADAGTNQQKASQPSEGGAPSVDHDDRSH